MKFNSSRQQKAGLLGRLLLPFFPKRVKKIQSEGFTLASYSSRYGKLDKLLRLGLIHKIISSNNYDELAQYHLQFWQSDEGAEYHKNYLEEFEVAFIEKFSYVIDEIKALCSPSGFSPTTLCEIGSGSGQLLHHLSRELPQLEQLIGIDLSPETVKDCNRKYGNQRVKFVAADGNQWIRENGKSNWIYFSHRGVLEYFPQEMLLDFFKTIQTQYQPTLFVAIEPVGVRHDPLNTTHSEPYNDEYSFSHPYEHLFRKAGFEIHDIQIKPYQPKYNLMCVIASSGLLVKSI